MFGFLIAVAAGYATPMIETPAAQPVAKMLGSKIEVEDNEVRLIAFILALLGAAIAASVLHTGSTIAIIVGVTLGYFGTRLVDLIKDLIDERKAPAEAEAKPEAKPEAKAEAKPEAKAEAKPKAKAEAKPKAKPKAKAKPTKTDDTPS